MDEATAIALGKDIGAAAAEISAFRNEYADRMQRGERKFSEIQTELRDMREEGAQRGAAQIEMKGTLNTVKGDVDHLHECVEKLKRQHYWPWWKRSVVKGLSVGLSAIVAAAIVSAAIMLGPKLHLPETFTSTLSHTKVEAE